MPLPKEQELSSQVYPDTAVSPAEPEAHTMRPSIPVAILMVLSVVPFMAGLFGLLGLFDVGQPCFALLFLLYWAAILRQDPKAYLPALLGSAGGIGMGWVISVLPIAAGRPGQLFAFLALGSILFCFMRGHAKLVVNNALMLFMLVATIPDFHIDRTIGSMYVALAVGAVYMGLVAVLFRWFMQRIGRKV
jgi:hypothetical protein